MLLFILVLWYPIVVVRWDFLNALILFFSPHLYCDCTGILNAPWPIDYLCVFTAFTDKILMKEEQLCRYPNQRETWSPYSCFTMTFVGLLFTCLTDWCLCCSRCFLAGVTQGWIIQEESFCAFVWTAHSGRLTFNKVLALFSAARRRTVSYFSSCTSCFLLFLTLLALFSSVRRRGRTLAWLRTS